MRVISGKFKGRRFQAPSSIKARPTTDMAREGLFNVLNQKIDLHGIKVLDLFTGTGAVSLEFLSRGAAEITAIDIDITSKKHLEKIKKDWDLKNFKVVKADVLSLAKKANQQFDLVFADPPYGHKRFSEIPNIILNSGWLEKSGLFILEHSSDFDFSSNPRFVEHRIFGNVNFTFFQ
jgi:16S rRNA (guanine(966)-N(2))-methyltransferase RsmD